MSPGIAMTPNFADRCRTLRRVAVAGGLVVLAAAAAVAAAAPETFGLEDPRHPVLAKALPEQPALPSQSSAVALGVVAQVALPSIDTAAVLAEDAARARLSGDKVLRFGVGRDLAVTPQDGTWYPLARGERLWAIEVVSPGALGLRLHFASLHLPPGARLAISPPPEAGAPALRVESHDASDATAQSSSFWSATVAGERVRIEYLAPAGAGTGLPFALDRLQHLYVDPVRAILGQGAGSCHNDVTCFPDWRAEARAVAGVGVIAEDSLFCTGQLLNDLGGDYTPYWLTAHHCVHSSQEARSAEIYWFYQTHACGGPPPSLSSVPTSLGATLLSTNASSDYTLLRIDGALPVGVYWAGWTAETIADGTPGAVIHHPSGDFKRISFGNKSSVTGCGGANHLRINYTDGPTEDGSSGAGVFRDDTHQLFGQLHCGPSACGAETNDDYGSFAATYPRVASFLRAGSDDPGVANHTCPTAFAVGAGAFTGRIVKYASPDWYRVRVRHGKTLTVTIKFARGNGNIDARLLVACGQPPAAISAGAGNSEVLRYTNTQATADLLWKVYLSNDMRNTYSMTVAIN